MTEVFDIGLNLLPLVEKFSVQIAKGEKKAAWFIVEYEIAGNCFLQVYYSMVKLRELKRIEELDREHKARLWEMSGKLKPQGDKKERIEVCRKLYMIEVLTEMEITL
jgi:hypothetical protein